MLPRATRSSDTSGTGEPSNVRTFRSPIGVCSSISSVAINLKMGVSFHRRRAGRIEAVLSKDGVPKRIRKLGVGSGIDVNSAGVLLRLVGKSPSVFGIRELGLQTLRDCHLGLNLLFQECQFLDSLLLTRREDCLLKSDLTRSLKANLVHSVRRNPCFRTSCGTGGHEQQIRRREHNGWRQSAKTPWVPVRKATTPEDHCFGPPDMHSSYKSTTASHMSDIPPGPLGCRAWLRLSTKRPRRSRSCG